MEGIVLDISILRRDYCDSIIQLPNNTIYRKNIDDSTLAGSCYICLQGWEIKEVTTLRCECTSWAHEACLAKSVFETGGCPIYRKLIFLIDNKIVLAQATADRDIKKARQLLDNKIQYSPRGFFGSTPLLQATENGQQETIRLLLKHSALISEQDEYQRTALYFVSAGGYAETTDEFLLHGADISPVNKKGQIFLHLVVLSKSIETVIVFLDKETIVSTQDLEGSIVLYLVVNQSHQEIINLLIDDKTEIRLVDKFG
jgi:hypothetical protein